MWSKPTLIKCLAVTWSMMANPWTVSTLKSVVRDQITVGPILEDINKLYRKNKQYEVIIQCSDCYFYVLF